MYKECFLKSFWKFFYNITKPQKRRIGQNWDADELQKQNAINGKRILSRNIEYWKKEKKTKGILKHCRYLQNEFYWF